MKKDFKSNIKGNINNENNNDKLVDNTNLDNDKTTGKSTGKFIIGKKQEVKEDRKVFNVYMDASKLRDLDKLAKKIKYNRNELINKMVDYCLTNLEIQED